MTSSSARRLVSFIAFCGLVGISDAQVSPSKKAPPKQMTFLPDYASAQRQAKASGLPILALVTGKDGKMPPAASDSKVVPPSKAFLVVLLPSNSPVLKKLEGAASAGVLILDAEGKTLAQAAADLDVGHLLAMMQQVVAETRPRLLEKLQNPKESAAAKRGAIDSYLRLDPSLPDLIGLLSHKQADVKAALQTALLAREAGEGADWALLNAMATDDAELRVACYPVAVALTKQTKLPPVKFWKEASADERATALEAWREAVYGKVPPLNRAVLDFVYANYGKQVGEGQCSHLANGALQHAKAQGLRREGKDYIWGQPLPKGETGLPGDIVQLDNARFANGHVTAHHTIIIRRVLAPGRYDILEQNSNGRLTVGPRQIDLNQVVDGRVVIFRPLPLPEKK